METIYAGLSLLPQGTLRRGILVMLRQTCQTRLPWARGTDRWDQTPNMTLMAERPTKVPSRTVPGHWEDDRIKGARNGLAVGTFWERTSRFVILAYLQGTDAQSACEGFLKKLRPSPTVLRTSLT